MYRFCYPCSGLTKPADFAEIHQNSAESVRTEFKNPEVLFTEVKFSKNQEKYYKKLEQILNVMVKKFFQIGNVSFVKIQISSNIRKWAHIAHDL
jgi:hypothetical protein